MNTPDTHTESHTWAGVFAGFVVAWLTQLVLKEPGLSMLTLVWAPIVIGAAANVLYERKYEPA